MKLIIPQDARKAVAEYCEQHIAPRAYYLHDSIGGMGWRMYNEYRRDGDNWKRQYSEWLLEVEDEQKAVIIRLKYGV